MVDEYSASRTLYEKHIADIIARRRMFYKNEYDPNRFIAVYIDPEDPRTLNEFNSKGLTCISADNDVLSGFQQGAFRFSQGTLSVFKSNKQLADSLRYHEWAKQVGEAAKRKEANDKWKHFSDTMRYLCNAPIWASEVPVEKKERGEGWIASELLYGMRKEVDLGDMSFNEWERLHG